MPVLSLDLGATIRGGQARTHVMIFYSEHPAPSIRLDESPLGDVDCASVEQYCGGNLTPPWPATDSVLSK